MPATGAPPGGSCSRFVPYFYRLLQCGQTPGTTGTAAACFDAESWRLCRGFAGAAMAAVFRWSSMVWDGLCCLRAESLFSHVHFHGWWWADVRMMGHAIGLRVSYAWSVHYQMGKGPGWSVQLLMGRGPWAGVGEGPGIVCSYPVAWDCRTQVSKRPFSEKDAWGWTGYHGWGSSTAQTRHCVDVLV